MNKSFPFELLAKFVRWVVAGILLIIVAIPAMVSLSLPGMG